MASEELLTLLLGLLSAIIIGIITCYFLRRHHGRKSDVQCTFCSTTYRSVLELEIIEEKDPVTGLCVNRFNSKTER
uniref:Uncharacterized protein LOC111110383 isoform X2 n=1 Tax=Crassostrea virginica TaxID=6565 RepID=A0A8B8BGS6_CRAVI|nr:uncharacterized protein LOC111110383 isoform X2 [Crassostrea virginica]